MAKQPEFKKYLPLEEWFHNQTASAQDMELTFDQVEAILGSPLPRSATKLTTWWTNVQPKFRVTAQPGSTTAGRYRNLIFRPGG
jgi:hypothetical protein